MWHQWHEFLETLPHSNTPYILLANRSMRRLADFSLISTNNDSQKPNTPQPTYNKLRFLSQYSRILCDVCNAPSTLEQMLLFHVTCSQMVDDDFHDFSSFNKDFKKNYTFWLLACLTFLNPYQTNTTSSNSYPNPENTL